LCAVRNPASPTHTLEPLGSASEAPPSAPEPAQGKTVPDARRLVWDSLRTSADQEEHLGNVLRMRKSVLLAVLVWPPFFLADIAMQRYAYPAASLAFQAPVRWLPWCFLLWSLQRLRRPPLPTPGQLLTFDTLVFGVLCLSVSISCLSFGGFRSHYASGIPAVLMCRAVLVHVPWRVSLAPALISALTYPLVQLLPTLWSVSAEKQLHDPAAVTILCGHILQILTTTAFTIGGGHVVWALRRQIFAARHVDRYRLLRPLGRGGMGEVWVAHHATMRREVALKMLRTDRLQDSVAQRRFEREVTAMMELMHPNSVRVFDYGVTEDGLMYYAMELLSGQELAELVTSRGPLAVASAVRLMEQVCGAVGEAHAKGIVHRDLKPENIFVCSLTGSETAGVSEQSFVKVLDFGIAKRTDDNLESALTQVARTLGTPLYMSPEVALGEPADTRSDVYALGAVLYFMLAGAPPFHGRSNTAVMIAHSQEQPLPPSTPRNAPLPAELERIVLRCLAKTPCERYADASELQRALAKLSI
jgi:tRNA A-37 threonylcarbamoyl transferase component Bud32